MADVVPTEVASLVPFRPSPAAPAADLPSNPPTPPEAAIIAAAGAISAAPYIPDSTQLGLSPLAESFPETCAPICLANSISSGVPPIEVISITDCEKSATPVPNACPSLSKTPLSLKLSSFRATFPAMFNTSCLFSGDNVLSLFKNLLLSLVELSSSFASSYTC